MVKTIVSLTCVHFIRKTGTRHFEFLVGQIPDPGSKTQPYFLGFILNDLIPLRTPVTHMIKGAIDEIKHSNTQFQHPLSPKYCLHIITSNKNFHKKNCYL